MDFSTPFWTYWYFHIPNYVLAVLIWTLIGRFLLSFFVPPDWENYIWRFFRRLTDPILAIFGKITPLVVSLRFQLLLSAMWLSLIRSVIFIGMIQAGVAPTPMVGG